jgi:hypothetical protein
LTHLGPQDEAREEEPAHWTLNALTQAARARGLKIARSQVRRILLAEGVRLSTDPLVGEEYGPRLPLTRTAVVTLYTSPPENGTTFCLDELGPVTPRLFAPPPGWSPDGRRIKAPLEYSRGLTKSGYTGRYGCVTGRR